MAKTGNLTGDLDQLWLMASNRVKAYREIVQQAEEGKLPIATKQEVINNANNLKTLIQQLGDVVDENIGALEYVMQENYLAKADLDPSMAPQFGLEWDADEEKYLDSLTGIYYETILTKIQAEAEAITESFTLQQATILQGNIDDLNEAMIENVNIINGQIKRGFITLYPGTPDEQIVFGIVIASRNVFASSGSTYTPEGETNVYYEIASDSGMAYGLYTATGWQFWNGDQKLGWFDTTDGQLHVNNINIEANFIMGDWRLTNNGTAWGIKYVG